MLDSRPGTSQELDALEAQLRALRHQTDSEFGADFDAATAGNGGGVYGESDTGQRGSRRGSESESQRLSRQLSRQKSRQAAVGGIWAG